MVPKHAKLAAEIPTDIPPLAVATHRVTQAMFNLVVNAGEAISEQGSVRVRAEALDDRRFVRIGVTDDGHGMPATVKRRALDPFFTTKKRGLSTGLGLALVHALVKSAGGSVEIKSEPRRGTTVTLTLPAVQKTESPRPRPEPERVATVSLTDDRMATLVAAVLRSAGFTVGHARGEDPGRARVWVVEPSPTALPAARRFLDGSGSRQVIVIGNGASEWTALGATIIERPAGLEAIQEAIRAAVACLGESADEQPTAPNPVC